VNTNPVDVLERRRLLTNLQIVFIGLGGVALALAFFEGVRS
jgi:hypothetical protein